ncbi:MAG: SRPBCC family protein [Thaumarchaeota archaeon]|nr:SRPBCC family protein [Nitrososphaerota archaeon]
MVEIKVKVQIDAPIEKVWEVVSRVDGDPKFWNLIKSMRNLSKNGNEIVREVTLGKTEKCHQEITLLPKEAVHVLWTKGVITGTKDIVLTLLGNTTLLEVKIDYKISGPARFFPETITDELHMEAELAVDLIKEKAEGKPHYIPMEERRMWADLIRG